MPTTPHPEGNNPSTLTTTEYDVVVLGAGSTGENVASRAHAGGLSVLVVEAELVGGDCSYWACMPSKVLLRSPEAVAAAKAVKGADAAVTGDVDVDAVLARRDSFVHGYDDSSQVEWLDSEGLTFVRGTGRLTGERTVEITGHDGQTVTVTARHAVALAVGSRPNVPGIDGLADAKPWTSRDATSAKQVPRRLLILGGGVVGVEQAVTWAALGSEQVTVIEKAERVLSSYEPEAGQRLGQAMADRGIDVRTGVSATSVTRDGAGVTVTLDGGDTVTGDEILVAIGRKPRTDDIGLETVGLEPGSYVETDDTLRVDGLHGGWLYAAGDVNGRALLTHQGKYQARACGDVIVARAAGDAEAQDPPAWSRFTATADHAAVPQVVFTDPQVASVGRTEAQARDDGLTVKAVTFELGDIAGAAVRADGYTGWAKLVVDSTRQVVVGATFLGPDVAELLHAATIAVVGEVPLHRLWHAVPAYPTVSEIWLRLLETYGL